MKPRHSMLGLATLIVALPWAAGAFAQSFSWQYLTLPEAGARAANACLGSDDRQVYFSRFQDSAGTVVWRIPKDTSDNGQWTNVVAVPGGWTSGGNGFGFDGVATLYTYVSRAGAPMTGIERCTPLLGTWQTNDRYFVSDTGSPWRSQPNTIGAEVDGRNIYGAWPGASQNAKSTNWANCARESEFSTTAGGHTWDTALSATHVYWLGGPGISGLLTGRLHRVTRTKTAAQQAAEINTVWQWCPWQVGEGLASEVVPGELSATGHDELWVLRGSGANVTNPDRGFGDPTTDLGIYDLVDNTWATYTLPQACGHGSDMKRVGRFMYIMLLDGVTENNLMFTAVNTPGVPDPQLQITTAPTNVPYSTATLTLDGTSAGAAGMLTWTNASSGATGASTAAPVWSAPAVPLAQGMNIILVRATNSVGVGEYDLIAISRDYAPSAGPPEIYILTPGGTVPDSTAFMTLNGSNNQHVVGTLRWSNFWNGAQGTLAATPTWTISDLPLRHGANLITVSGTNALGQLGSTAVTVTREHSYFINLVPVGLPEEELRSRSSALVSDGTNLLYTRGEPLAAAPLFLLPPGGASSNDWQARAALPANNELGRGLAYHHGYIYGNAALWDSLWPSNNFAVLRYNLGADVWESSVWSYTHGAANACVLDNNNNLYSFWPGWDNLEKISNWVTSAEAFQSGLGGGAAHPWDSTRSASYIYVLKWYGESFSRIFRFPAAGATSPTQIVAYVDTPAACGMGASLEYVPASESVNGHEELWLLRGCMDGAADGQGGVESSDLYVYDLSDKVWSHINLSPDEQLYYGEGADMCRVGGQLFFMTGADFLNGTGSNLMATVFIPEPASLLLALPLLLLLKSER